MTSPCQILRTKLLVKPATLSINKLNMCITHMEMKMFIKIIIKDREEQLKDKDKF
jgi:hypothetical protein